MPHLFLTGYEKETIEEFIEKLKREHIDVVIDIREIPLSRKNGFSKNNLEKLLLSHGIRYFHYQELGSPSKIRSELRSTGDYLKFFKEYRIYAKKKITTLKNVLNVIHAHKHSVLLCFEKDCELCHRTIVASELLKLNPHLQVTPI